MGDIGSSCHIGGTTLARLVTEETSFDAHHDGHAQATTGHLIKTKCVLDNQFEHMRYHVDVHDNDIQSKDEIAYSHNRHKNAAHMGNAPNAAKRNE